MTFVDDSLTGAVSARGGKAGAKGAKQTEMAAQKDAFNRAFSEAGKKQQPQISIRDKANAETQTLQGTQSRISIQSAAVNSAKDVDQDANAGAGETALLEAEQVRQTMPVDGEIDPTDAVDDRQAADKDAKTPHETKQARAQALLARLAEQQNSQTDVAQGEEPADADGGTAAKTDLAKKLADIFKERQTQVSSKTQPDEKTAASQDLSDEHGASAAAQTKNGDVNQLLALLGASQSKAADTDTSNASSDFSEFQALAERAGKGKSSGKELSVTVKTSEAAHDKSAVADVTAGADKSEKDQLFRFARADGKGQDVSIAIDKDRETATVDPTGASGGKAETVTVVEARRYLGLAPSTNAQAVTSAIAGSSEWAQSVQSLTSDTTLRQQATGKVVNTLKIQMHPIDLGMVTATLRLKDDELHVDLKVETGDAFRQLSDDQNAMIKALRAQGFAVDQVNIVFNAPDSNSGNGGAQQQGQPQAGGQPGREASAGGGTSQGRQQHNDGGNERWTANETTGNVSSADAGGSGDVYM